MMPIRSLFVMMLLAMPITGLAKGQAALLNKVTLPLKAEQWVTTQTALLNVGVNATVSDKGMEQIQAEVMQNLKQLSNKSEWHIISFNRSADRSGLESIQITAQARLPQSELSTIRTKAKNMSKPGITYSIDDIAFTPSEDEIRAANVTLRGHIYQQAKNEIDALNKLYPEQKYYLHEINFLTTQPVMAPMAYRAKTSADETAAAPLSIGNKLQIDATVVVASFPDQLVTAVKG